MENDTSGSCLCGAVSFDICGEFESFFLCYCSRCRKDSGSAHGANLFSSKAEIKWLTGQSNIKTYQLPETRHTKSFCKDCGSALPSLQMDGALLVVPAGALNDQIDIRPNARICFASRAKWIDCLDIVESIDGLPS